METIDYATRADLVAALVDFRKQGVRVEVVHNGRTLAFPDGVNAAHGGEQPEPEIETLTEQVEAPADGVEKTPVEGDTLLGVVGPEDDSPLDRSNFTTEGTCSECGQPALAEPEGGWVHVDAATHADNAGEFVPNEPAAEEPVEEPGDEDDEDIIGTPPPAKNAPKKSSKRNRGQS